MLRTWESVFGGLSVRAIAASFPSRDGDGALPVAEVAVGPAVEARVNGGRWIADCPADGCHGAEYVSFADPAFFCCECRNAAWGHRLLPVLLPSEEVRARVEAYLAARPDPRTRNWRPSEPLRALREENRRMGVRLP